MDREVNIFAVIILAIWSMFWKGVALWKASKGHQKNWFIAIVALFYFNTLGLFELIYLFKFAKHKLTIDEMKGWFAKKS